jgi:imidazolonepropionase
VTAAAALALVDLTLATMTPGPTPYGLVADGIVIMAGGAITAAGRRDDVAIPGNAETYSLGGRLVTPGLVDCHTHLVFAGDRATEFEARLGGATYAEITAAGGGIRSTVAATRRATEAELFAAALPRLLRLHHTGVTTIEIKSGYGLDLASELAMLQVARRLGVEGPATVRTTLLAAHVVPPEFEADPDRYVDLVVEKILPAAAENHLADAVDVFCEHLAFTPDQTDRIFSAAARASLPVKLHAAQLAPSEGVDVAARHRALSADHLEHATPAQVGALAESGTVAVLLPGATHMLREPARPPIDALREHGVPMALASDLNPGTSPVADLALVCNLGAVLFGLTPEEALAGVTRNGATALGLRDRGQVQPGLRADLAVWDISHPAEISYWAGMDLCSAVWVGGVQSFDRNL